MLYVIMYTISSLVYNIQLIPLQFIQPLYRLLHIMDHLCSILLLQWLHTTVVIVHMYACTYVITMGVPCWRAKSIAKQSDPRISGSLCPWLPLCLLESCPLYFHLYRSFQLLSRLWTLQLPTAVDTIYYCRATQQPTKLTNFPYRYNCSSYRLLFAYFISVMYHTCPQRFYNYLIYMCTLHLWLFGCKTDLTYWQLNTELTYFTATHQNDQYGNVYFYNSYLVQFN